MGKLVAKLGVLVASATISVGLVSCGGESTIGKVRCKNSNTFAFSAKIPSRFWPSRGVFFDAIRHDAYYESIYDASVSSVLKNTGKESFIVVADRAKIEEQTVSPGSSCTLPTQKFRDYYIVIVPSPGKKASVDFKFSLDRPVTTDGTWKLVAAWGDGP